mgnify:FL=1
MCLRDMKKSEQKYESSVVPENPDLIMEVWIRDINFFDVQNAAQNMFTIKPNGETELNLEGYWTYAFTNWVVKTNPSLTPTEMTELQAYVANQIVAHLPKPDQLAEMMQGGFQKASN